jgi:serine/threonine protein kinase
MTDDSSLVTCEINDQNYQEFKKEESSLAKGNFGVVYKIKHPDYSTIYCLKEQNFGTPILKERVTREANILKEINRPNIVKYFYHFFEVGKLSIVMEFIDGVDLDSIMK